MIQMQTNLDVADNSGARRVMCIKVLGGAQAPLRRRRRHDRRVREGSDSARPREEGRRAASRRRAHRQGNQRKDGSVIRFDKNAAVIVNKQNEPIGTRIFGPVAARTARQEPHEDHLARAGGAVMAAKIKKGDRVVVLAGKDKGSRARSRGAAQGQQGVRRRA